MTIDNVFSQFQNMISSSSFFRLASAPVPRPAPLPPPPLGIPPRLSLHPDLWTQASSTNSIIIIVISVTLIIVILKSVSAAATSAKDLHESTARLQSTIDGMLSGSNNQRSIKTEPSTDELWKTQDPDGAVIRRCLG